MAGVLVHEWIERSGGAEKVLDEFVNCYPDADLYCLWNDAPERYSTTDVNESALAATPLRRSKALALPAMPFTWRGLANRDYDFALISSHLFAHHATFRGSSAEFRNSFTYIRPPGMSGILNWISGAIRRWRGWDHRYCAKSTVRGRRRVRPLLPTASSSGGASSRPGMCRQR